MNMNDREMLELAAKAAGIKGDYMWSGLAGGVCIETGDCMANQGHWNPLTDDGDALRLAMKLGFKVEAGRCYTNDRGTFFGEDVLQGTNKATRRAIVRAAAAKAAATC